MISAATAKRQADDFLVKAYNRFQETIATKIEESCSKGMTSCTIRVPIEITSKNLTQILDWLIHFGYTVIFFDKDSLLSIYWDEPK